MVINLNEEGQKKILIEKKETKHIPDERKINEKEKSHIAIVFYYFSFINLSERKTKQKKMLQKHHNSYHNIK